MWNLSPHQLIACAEQSLNPHTIVGANPRLYLEGQDHTVLSDLIDPWLRLRVFLAEIQPGSYSPEAAFRINVGPIAGEEDRKEL